MFKEYAYIKLRHLRWAVTPNGQSLVYFRVIQNGVWNTRQSAFPQQLSVVKDYRL